MIKKIIVLLIFFVTIRQDLFPQSDCFMAHWYCDECEHDYNIGSVPFEFISLIDLAALEWNGVGFGCIYLGTTFGDDGTINFSDLGSTTCNTGIWAETILTLGGDHIIYCTTHINSNSTVHWSTDPEASEVDFESTMIHEFGHWFGLYDVDDITSTMGYLPCGAIRLGIDFDSEMCISLLCPPTGVEDYINVYTDHEVYDVNTTHVGCQHSNFIDNFPYGDFITQWYDYNVWASSSCGDILVSSNGIIIPTLPEGYFWNRDGNGNVIAKMTRSGIDNDGILHTGSTQIKIGNVPNTFITSGTLTSNTNWCGEITVTGNITVPTGITLTVNPGAVIKFANNSSLIVLGKLDALMCTFTSQSGTTNSSWGTITLSGSGASGSTLKYANVKYGTKVQATNTSNITIQYCNIDTTYDGIRFYNSSGSILNNIITTNSIGHGIVIENASTATVNDNVITKTNASRSGVGIYFGGGSGGSAARNDIYHWDWGICANWSSSPTSQCGYYPERNNRIRNCNTGLMVYRLSYPVFGIPPTSNNMWNSLSGNSYNAKVGMSYTNYASSLVAYGNYWGGYPPDAAKFQIGPSANIYYSYALTSDPWSGMSKIVANTSANSDEYNEISQTSEKDIELILYGNELRGQGKYSEAKDYFISYINENPDNQIAYIQLYNCYNKETANEIIKFFSSLTEKASKDHKLLLSYLYLKNGDFKIAKEVNNSIIAENPNTELATKAKLNNVYIALYNEDNINEAITTFNDALSKSKLSTPIELSLVRNAIETYGKTYGKEINGLAPLPYLESSEQDLVKQEVLNKIGVPDKYELIGNYPNPFNPSTTISYALPYQSSVELIVYDIMGREVKSFNVSSQSAGYNRLVWDGRNENGNPITSGVYFYRINIKSLENNESFVKTAKLIMLK